MKKPQRVASMFPVVDSEGRFWPHLYASDVEQLQEYINAYMTMGEESTIKFATLLQRLLDWIVAESVTATQVVKMVAVRQEDGTIVVTNIDTGISGTPQNNILPALVTCAVEMQGVFTAIEEAGEDADDTFDWVKNAKYWVDNFPFYQEETIDQND